jgi:hypothetical protein
MKIFVNFRLDKFVYLCYHIWFVFANLGRRNGKMKIIYVVTHGKKFSGPNPGMTEEGFAEVAKLRSLLPAELADVVCGTGKRHLDVAKALGLEFTRVTSAVGGPDSGEASVKGGLVDIVRLPCGTTVPYSAYTTLLDGASAMVAVVTGLPENSVVCAGRPSMIMLGMPESVSKSAAVYRVCVQDAMWIAAIEEVIATGESEINTV